MTVIVVLQNSLFRKKQQDNEEDLLSKDRNTDVSVTGTEPFKSEILQDDSINNSNIKKK